MGRKILADAGYDVVTVNNGSAALKRITEIKPDLIVLDVYMPGYSGLEVCQRLKDAAATAHIPVLLTVGKLEPLKPEEARRVRADAHIVKPFEASELLSAITRLEDRMVPQQSEGGRYSTSASGVERFSGEGNGRTTESKAGADTGWKSRLGFPSKKKKEEPEPESEDIAPAATFRDFRKAKGKTGASVPLTVKEPPPPGQEPGLVPDIPRDITPEELDALSALAANLEGPPRRVRILRRWRERWVPACLRRQSWRRQTLKWLRLKCQRLKWTLLRLRQTRRKKLKLRLRSPRLRSKYINTKPGVQKPSIQKCRLRWSQSR